MLSFYVCVNHKKISSSRSTLASTQNNSPFVLSQCIKNDWDKSETNISPEMYSHDGKWQFYRIAIVNGVLTKEWRPLFVMGGKIQKKSR